MVLMVEVNKGLRFISLVGFVFLANIALYFVFVTAPTESLYFLKENVFWSYAIIACFNFSTITSTTLNFFPEIKDAKEVLSE